MLYWYAIHTQSRFEKKILPELTRKRIESYLPLIPEVHQWKDREKTVEVPVFPGYVFARIVDCPGTRLQILRTTGVVRILGPGDRIEPVPDAEIDSIRRLLKSNLLCFAHPFLHEGAWVRIRRGPLRDLEGQLVRVKNQTRLVLSIALLSQSVATEIDIRDAEVIRPRTVAKNAA